MHYIRLLKSPSLVEYLAGGTGKLQWRLRMRVAKAFIDVSGVMQQVLKSKCKFSICVSTEKYSARGVRNILATTVVSEEESAGQVTPVWIALSHDQDAIESCMLPTPTDTEPFGLKALRDLFTGPKPINALELGCGVGILGGGLSIVFPRTRPPPSRRCTILMTDLEEAENRTRSNIRNGMFGPEAQSHRWDLVLLSDCTYNVDMLPALVGRLSALHKSNTAQAGEQPQSTKDFLATKPRHASEEALFDLLSDQGWTELHRQTLPLPVLGAETQCVELYLYEKV
ncbi:hypothetical protein V8C35DRAFT_328733 [Trichoderma chlorosporum]